VAEPVPLRAYTAPCPGCGAPVAFRSAQSTHAVCGFCQSTVVRDGETLSRIGKMAEVFEDYSTLQLFASGRWKSPQATGGSQTTDPNGGQISGQSGGRSTGFTVIGRLQYKTASGTWNDWQLALDDGRTASLSEDNGAFVFSTAVPAPFAIPPVAQFQVGVNIPFNGVPFTVTSSDAAVLLAAQGELPKLPPLGQAFPLVELRSAQGEVLSIDYSSQPPTLFLGSETLLDDLKLVGLRDTSTQEVKGQQFNCPNCGAPVTVALATSKSITCGSCQCLIDLSAGVGNQLQHALQNEPVQLLIPLGSQGVLQGLSWQVVGFQHRMGVEQGDDEHFGWSEYLLYNPNRGFNFLVDSEEGWSVVKPTTGAPNMSTNGQSATYLATRYALKSTYIAETTYVAGEFYWPVRRGQKTSNRDFANGQSLLSLEQTPNELTWSSGNNIDSALVAQAFKLEAKADLLKRTDVAPTASLTCKSFLTVLLICLTIFVVLLLIRRCSSCDANTQDCRSSSSGSAMRSSGGAFGGFAGGGGHK